MSGTAFPMAHTYNLFFVWRGAFEATRTGPNTIEAENTLEAIRNADAFWRAQTFTEWPLGFDLFDSAGQPVHQFRSGHAQGVQTIAK
jgi:hypothetical protein